MKKQDGVSMIALVVTIVVILILASISISSGMGSIDEASKTKIDMELRGIKDAVADRMIDNVQNPAKYPLMGKKVEDITEYLHYIENITNEEITSFVQSMNEENMDYYRLLDSIAAKNMGVDSVSEEHYYVVDYYTGKVYGPVNMEDMENADSGE